MEHQDQNQFGKLMNLSFGDDASESSEYIFDREDVRIIFLILYTIVFCCCFFGNLMVVLVVSLHWRMRSITNFCLGNLAFADLCVGIFCVYQNIVTYLMDSWVFGELMCKMYHFTISLSTTASVLILVVICIERYFAIIHPMTCKRMLTKSRLRVTIATVWILSAAISSPRFYYFRTIRMPLPNNQVEILCLPDRTKYNSKLMDMLSMTVLYLIPLTVITYLYTLIGLALWKSSSNRMPANSTPTPSAIDAQHCCCSENQPINVNLPPENAPLNQQNFGSIESTNQQEIIELECPPPQQSILTRVISKRQVSSLKLVPKEKDREQEKCVKCDAFHRHSSTSPKSNSSDDVCESADSESNSVDDRSNFYSKFRSNSQEVLQSKTQLTCQINNIFKETETISESLASRREQNGEEQSNAYDETSFIKSADKLYTSHAPGNIQGHHPPETEMLKNAVSICHQNSTLPLVSFTAKSSLSGDSDLSNAEHVCGEMQESCEIIGSSECGISSHKHCNFPCSPVAHNDNMSSRLRTNENYTCSNDQCQLRHLESRRKVERRVRITKSCRSGTTALLARKRVIRMLIAVVLTFAVCHLPFHARKVWQYWSPAWAQYEAGSVFSTLFTPITFLILYANSAINPVLYAFMSKKFQMSFRDLLCCKLRRSFRNVNMKR